VNASLTFTRVSEWVLRKNALREARAAVVPRGARRDLALCQARLLLEVARRVEEPVERFPPGARPPVRLGLYREAAFWALAATRARDGEAAADLAGAWADADPERLRRAAPDEATLDHLKRALVEGSQPDPLDVTTAEADRARLFVEALIGEMDAPRRRVAVIRATRFLRLGALTLALLLVVWGGYRLSLGPNLLAGKPFRTSSSWSGCSSDPGCQALLFHTDPEFNPWVEFDLGAPKTFRRLEVTNRTDCCADRTIPLVAETSDDRVNWKEISRRDTEFSTWTVKFAPRTARYLRLRVARHSTFHLKDVALR
jgi:hypothetical protein